MSGTGTANPWTGPHCSRRFVTASRPHDGPALRHPGRRLPGARQLRVVSWNIRSLRDGAPAVAGQLGALRPDIAVLQEAPRLLLWRASRRRLARAAGLRLVTRRRAGGNALLVAPGVEVLSSWVEDFPKRPGLHRRSTVGAVISYDGRPLAVAGSHLDLAAGARRDTARRVRAAAPAAVPLVLGADVNEQPGGEAWALLAAGLVDAGGPPTFPADRPARRLDVLLVDPALTVLSHRAVPTSASDHLPIVVDVDWAPEGAD